MTLSPRALMPLLVVLGLILATLVLVPASASAASAASSGRHWPGHPGRTLVDYRVRSGDTASVIARRFHAWTAELLRINHRSASSVWRVGERVVVPVVAARAAAAEHRARRTSREHPSKVRVRNEVVKVAHAHGMRPKLALAIAWQESGWQQDVRSPVGAVGTMQVMPGNKAWLSRQVGRELKLKHLHDNVTAGVVLFRLLRADHSTKKSIAGYYQGLGSIHQHGRYPSTKAYVANVQQHWTRLRHGWDPLS